MHVEGVLKNIANDILLVDTTQFDVMPSYFIFGGYLYITAYGDTEKHERAMRTLTYAIIGLILALTAYGIVAIVTSIQLS